MKLVLIGGSLRPASLNLRFLLHLSGLLAEAGHELATCAGSDLRLPLYEEGLAAPDQVASLHGELQKAQGLVIVSPEYNAGIPGHLKNAVDWLSVQKPNPFDGLPVLLCACSPGALGGARALLPWRATLANMGAVVAPGAITVPRADQNLDLQGAPTDRRTQDSVHSTLASFLSIAERLKPPAA